MSPRDALLLGRVSNLPTVWTNFLAGAVLVGATLTVDVAIAAVIALTFFYVGGMYLNDAFDAEIDAKERPERPIPSGRVSKNTVMTLGFGMLLLGTVGLGLAGSLSGTDWLPALAGLGLAAAIVLYNAWHKGNPLSPFIMGVCRMLVYIAAALTLSSDLNGAVLVGALVLLAYLIGLTYVAKQENIGTVSNMWPLLFLATPVLVGLWQSSQSTWMWLFVAGLLAWILFALKFIRRAGPGDIPRAVISLIAGICIVDGLLIAGAGDPELGALALVGFVLTLALQRFVPGT